MAVTSTVVAGVETAVLDTGLAVTKNTKMKQSEKLNEGRMEFVAAEIQGVTYLRRLAWGGKQ